MKNMIVRYRVKTDRAEENARLVQAVFVSLASERPEGFRYATFRLDDGVSFVHIVSLDDEDRGSPLQKLDAFKAFVADIHDRCDVQPETTVLHALASYRFFESMA
ncbi:MAG: hypothetical protein ABI969_13740 [bacterium]